MDTTSSMSWSRPVKGRPIFVKSNTETGFGRVNARVNASVLGLYDSARLQQPHLNGEETTMGVFGCCGSSKGMHGRPKGAFDRHGHEPQQQAGHCGIGATGVEHVQCDAVSYSAAIGGHEMDYGRRVFPSYRFDQAEPWCPQCGLPRHMGGQRLVHREWAKTRRPKTVDMSRLHAFESGMSLTGSNADRRTRVKPSEQGRVAAALLRELTGEGAAVHLDEAVMAASRLQLADLKRAGAKGWWSRETTTWLPSALLSAINRHLGALAPRWNCTKRGLLPRRRQGFCALVSDMKAGQVCADRGRHQPSLPRSGAKRSSGLG